MAPPDVPVIKTHSKVPTLLVVMLIVVAIFGGVSQLGSSARKTMDEITAEARNNPVPSGRHCLDMSIGGLHADLWLTVKASLHNPDSMRDMVMDIDPVTPAGQHKIRFQFRAQNAYGALRLQTVEASVLAKGCGLVTWRLV